MPPDQSGGWLSRRRDQFRVRGRSAGVAKDAPSGGLELREYYSFAKPHIVEAILNHVSGHKAGVAGVYIGAAEKREALEQWAVHLMGLPSASKQTVSENSGETGNQLVSGTRG